ncbi:MAG: hypothetical protein A2836_03925 [Candidatus Taylorbacteria bacterium RIFCSPHIGHO2_01_FULL_45_63]|uniref:Sortase n=1 Tax=Candidatus Taylorbacteria bacterium RIFCSPHIGHO2_02_FULL_45_35 TaxID=1802311 RepID=A0A1G2MT00_9BACT|nr:MAG: hypothetical protein A2836_03925 [Candidatus Taylorbacteria bacterium RIFCSPHIGHO2_01_FULL_45_63]OHA26111.1 MAG: hypothetical protein A3D56_01665 [Candidatus Taylorbacteria bacterium RIFCSPHIGHO2_02_FULL_45_35]OHA32541.1 MAG: hypothetical protein A3A22_03345 [Candidatus Taylorbacteria bacterium RIFCSPLOWO2_01_FULL_45_34b]
MASLGLLFAMGFVPVEIKDAAQSFVSFGQSIYQPDVSAESNGIVPVPDTDGFITPTALSIQPKMISIEKIGVLTSIENPDSRDISVLDQALQKGVVHYPGSGSLEDDSNMFLFGHSTTIKTVRNQAYKALNRLGELALGDEIKVRSDDREYVYTVFSVSLVDQNEALVEFSKGKRMLTLSTCNTFGAREERFVVEAKYARDYEISNMLN